MIHDTCQHFVLCSEFVFETRDGTTTIRDHMQTLAPTLKIESSVIDAYSLILNHENKMENNNNKTKHFFSTQMIVSTYNRKKRYHIKYTTS